MEDKKLNVEESLALIGRMIDNTRNRLVRNSGRPFLIWGYTTVLVTAAVSFAVWQTGNHSWNFLWLTIPLIGWLAMWLTRSRVTSQGRVYTFVDRVIVIVWAVTGATTIFVSLLTMFVTLKIPILFIVMLLIGMAVTVVCLIIRLTVGTATGIVCILLAPLLLFSTGWWTPLIFAGGFVLMNIIPGHVLNYKSKHTEK